MKSQSHLWFAPQGLLTLDSQIARNEYQKLNNVPGRTAAKELSELVENFKALKKTGRE